MNERTFCVRMVVRASSWADLLKNWVFDRVKPAERSFVNLVLADLQRFAVDLGKPVGVK